MLFVSIIELYSVIFQKLKKTISFKLEKNF